MPQFKDFTTPPRTVEDVVQPPPAPSGGSGGPGEAAPVIPVTTAGIGPVPPAGGQAAPTGPGDISTEPADYDYAAAAAAGVKPDERGHMPDTYKLPNHITFSDESIYHGKDGNQGGKWEKAPDGHWLFTPGKTNLEQHTPEELRSYFAANEPEASLVMPHPAATRMDAGPTAPVDIPLADLMKPSGVRGKVSMFDQPGKVPGIALPSRATLGKHFEVTTHDGRKFIAQQTDTFVGGPKGRTINVNTALAKKMGYKSAADFPTDATFAVRQVENPTHAAAVASAIKGTRRNALPPQPRWDELMQ